MDDDTNEVIGLLEYIRIRIERNPNRLDEFPWCVKGILDRMMCKFADRGFLYPKEKSEIQEIELLLEKWMADEVK
jgi:hypothetical protein